MKTKYIVVVDPGVALGQTQKPPFFTHVEYYQPSSYQPLTEAYHDHWNEFHTKKDPTPEWFADWMSRIPSFCQCGSSFEKFVETNPPRFDDWFAYSVEMHNLVNLKPEVDHTVCSLEDAKRIWLESEMPRGISPIQIVRD